MHECACVGIYRVGLLVCEEILERFAVEILEEEVEDVLWVGLSGIQEEEEWMVLPVYYIPP